MRRRKIKAVRNKNSVPIVRKKKAVAKKVRKTRAPRTRNAETMTETEYFSKIRSALRNAFRWWIPMKNALIAASRPSQSTNRRLKTEYKCAICKRWFSRREVEVDHIIECGSLNCFEDIPTFIQRLTIEELTGFQILCKPCHSIKTKAYLQNKKLLKNKL